MEMNRQLLESLAGWHNSKAVILGVGNVLKGDDAAGPLVCERLKESPSAAVIDAGTVPENYIRPILKTKPDILLIIDAVDFGGSPGEIRVFDPVEIHRFAFSTHALSLHLFVEMLRTHRPVEVRVIGIQAGSCELGGGPSPAVQTAIEMLAATLEMFHPRSVGL
jgi:hydrogenase 3 maturation protease